MQLFAAEQDTDVNRPLTDAVGIPGGTAVHVAPSKLSAKICEFPSLS